MSQPARPDPARAPTAPDRPAPPLPARPQHRTPALRRLTTASLTPQQPMTPASPAATCPMATRSAATATRPQISARLPVSDWQIRWRRQPDGRTVLEVTATLNSGPGTRAQRNHRPGPRHLLHKPGATRAGTPQVQVHEICHPLTTPRRRLAPMTRRHQPLKVTGAPH
jgi:hypothetical protein